VGASVDTKTMRRTVWNRAENQWFHFQRQREFKMGPVSFVIAILGCADGGSACTPVATLPTQYQSASQCSKATVKALEANNDFDFPTLVARCRSGASVSAQAQPAPPSRGVARGE